MRKCRQLLNGHFGFISILLYSGGKWEKEVVPPSYSYTLNICNHSGSIAPLEQGRLDGFKLFINFAEKHLE